MKSILESLMRNGSRGRIDTIAGTSYQADTFTLGDDAVMVHQSNALIIIPYKHIVSVCVHKESE